MVKEMVRMFLWTGLALLLGLKGAVPVSAREAGALDYTALRGGKSINHKRHSQRWKCGGKCDLFPGGNPGNPDRQPIFLAVSAMGAGAGDI